MEIPERVLRWVSGFPWQQIWEGHAVHSPPLGSEPSEMSAKSKHARIERLPLIAFGDTPSWNEVHSCLFSLNKEMDFICTKCVAWYVACACMCRILPRGTQPNPSWGARRQTNTCYTMFVTCSGLRRRMFRISEMGALAMLLALSFAAKRISSSICGTWCNIPYQHGVTCDTVP